MHPTPNRPSADPHQHGYPPGGVNRAPWLALAAALAGCVVVGLSGSYQGVMPPCLFKTTTGLDCPGCGLTRGTRQLLNGHPLAALHHNILLLAIVPLTAWSWLVWAGAPLPRVPRLSGRGTWWVVAGLVVFAVVRNLPLPVFRWLNSSGTG